MFSEPITLRDAVITAIHLKVQDGKVQSRIMLHGSLNQEAADTLGAKSLIFATNGTPKEGFSSVRLATGCAAFRATFEADPALKQSFELASGDSSDRFVVERQAEGALLLKLRLNYHGDPHLALGYIQAVGSAESLLRITPFQTEIDESDRAKKNREYAEDDRQQDLLEPATDAARPHLISHQRTRAKPQLTV